MSVEVKSGVCGLVSADKYNLIAVSDYDKIGDFCLCLVTNVLSIKKGGRFPLARTSLLPTTSPKGSAPKTPKHHA